MKTREEQQAMVDRLKTTWTAFGGLSKEEQEFLKYNQDKSVTIDGKGSIVPFEWNSKVVAWDGWVIRLSPDFQLPPEPVKERTVKWFNCETGRTLDCPEGICPGEAWVTVPVKVEPTFDSIIERLEQVIKELKEQK